MWNFIVLFSSPDPQSWISYSHHLVSVMELSLFVFTFESFSKLFYPLEPNLAGMFILWFLTKFKCLVLIKYSLRLPEPLMDSDLSQSFDKPRGYYIQTQLSIGPCANSFISETQNLKENSRLQ